MELSNLVCKHVLSGIERGVKPVNDLWYNEFVFLIIIRKICGAIKGKTCGAIKGG